MIRVKQLWYTKVLASLFIVGLLGCVRAEKQAPPQWRQFLISEFALSPQGTHLGYSVFGYDNLGDQITEVWVSKLDGSDKHRVGRLEGNWNIEWHNPEQLVATQFDGNRVYLLPRSGENPTAIPITGDFRWATPTLSPDGKSVAFPALDKSKSASGIHMLDLQTGKVQTLYQDTIKSYITWSPDSRKIAYGAGAYQKNYNLKILDVESKTVTDTSKLGVGAAWSPDGEWIAYTGNVVQGGSWYSGVPLDGSIVKTHVKSSQTVALTDPAVNIWDEKTKRWEIAGAILPRWSPDGKKIAYNYRHQIMDNTTHKDLVSEDQLWVINSDGTNKRKVFENPGAYVWAPDSQSLFVKWEEGIARVPLDTAGHQNIVNWAIPTVPEITEADWITLKGKGAELIYARIKPEYAQAILTLTEASRQILVEDYGCDLPAVVGVRVSKDPTAGRTSLWNDGESHIFLTVASMQNLAPSYQSGTFNIYGISHELGHMTMYRRAKSIGLPPGVAEGWAYYVGSVITDQVYKKLGKELWPTPYDYSSEGSARLQSQAASAQTSTDPTTKAALAFYAAHQR